MKVPRLHDGAILGFGITVAATVAALLIGGIIGYRNVRELDQNRQIVTRTHEVIGSLEMLFSMFKDAETGQRGYLLTQNETYLETYKIAVDQEPVEVARLKELIGDNPEQLAVLDRLDAKIGTRLDMLKQSIDQMRQGNREAALKFIANGSGKALTDEIRQHVAEMVKTEQLLLVQRDTEAASSYRLSMLSILSNTIVGIMLVGVIFVLTQRNIRRRYRAAVALAEQKERLRTTLASIGDGVISTNATGDVTYLNPVAESLTGWTNADAHGVSLTQVFDIVNETTREPVENPALRALREGIIVGLANHTILLGRDGTERAIDDSAAPIRSIQGELVGSVLVFRDISERKQAEKVQSQRARLVALRADVSTVLTSDFEVASALQKVCAEFVQHVDIAFARIWTLDESQTVLELQASAGLYAHLDNTHARVPVGQFKVGRIASTRQSYLTNDVANDPEVSDLEWAKREGMVAFAGYPLLVDGRLQGVFAMFARQPLPQSVLAELEPLIDSIAQYIDRRHAETQDRQSRERLRMALSAARMVAWEMDPTTGQVVNSDNAAEIYGVSDSEANNSLEQRCSLVHPEDAESYREVIANAIASGEEFYTTYRITRPDNGAVQWMEKRGYPVRRDERGPLRLVGVTIDATQRKLAEDQFQTSEMRRRLAIDAAELGTWHVDLQSMTLTTDERFRMIYGIAEPEISYEQAVAIVHRDDQQRVLDAVSAAIRIPDPVPYAIEYRVTRPDGTIRWVFAKGKTNAVPMRGSYRLTSFDGTLTDITERKRAVQAILENERRLRFIMDSMPQKVFTATASGDVDYFNPVWSDFTGLTFDEIKNWGWTQLIHPDDVEQNVLLWKQAVATGEPFEFEHRFRAANGEYRWHVSRATALKDDAGQILMWVGANTDMHEQRKIQDELREVAARLSEADRRKDEFLAILAHELRNPLAPIRNGLKVIGLSRNNQEAIENARIMMERQLGQMVRLVDDLLDVSRISRGRLELRKERLELTTVLNSAIETSRPLIEASGHQLTVAFPSEPVYVDADLVRLAQVFANLLNNAAKYSERGGHITLAAARRDDQVVVSVRDTGVGIPANMLPRIFDLFIQVDRSLEKSQGGLGIGLSLVQRLVEMHDGTVEAQSEGHGLGSEFIVTLPVVAIAPEDADLLVGPGEIVSPLTRRRILVADDNVDSANSLAMLLELFGNHVQTANDGLAAVLLAEKFIPQVIMLDIGMPKLNGYETCRRIREFPWGAEAIIIALTGWGQDEDKRLSKEAGFDHHIVKPVDPDELEKLLVSI